MVTVIDCLTIIYYDIYINQDFMNSTLGFGRL